MSERKQEVLEHLRKLQQMFYDSECWTYAGWVKEAIDILEGKEPKEEPMSLSEIEAKLEEIDERIRLINEHLNLEFN